MPAQDSEGGKPASTSGTRLVEPTPAAENTQPSQVLMQRVIALSGVVEISDKAARQPVLVAPAEAPKVDLSRTSLEWGGRQIGAKAQTALPDSAPDLIKSNELDAEWATHSSIRLELCEDSLLTSRLLSLSIDDAVTKQYTPNAVTSLLGASSNEPELVSKLLEADPVDPAPALAAPREASGGPKMLVVPAGLAWAVAGAFSVCALALVYLVTAFLACGHPSRLDPLGMRCVDRADVAKAR